MYQSRLPLRGGGAVGRWRLAQLGAVYAAICAHGAVVAYTDPLPDPTFITLLLLFRCAVSMHAPRLLQALECRAAAIP